MGIFCRSAAECHQTRVPSGNEKAVFAMEDGFFREPAGARTQDPNIKSVVLYLLSYGFNTRQTVETIFFRFGGANVEIIFVLPK